MGGRGCPWTLVAQYCNDETRRLSLHRPFRTQGVGLFVEGMKANYRCLSEYYDTEEVDILTRSEAQMMDC